MITRTLVFLIGLLTAAGAAAQSRAGKSEVYLSPVFTDGKSYSFEGGSSARTDTGFGITLGFAHNFTPLLAAGIEIGWSEQDYSATVQPGPGNTLGFAGRINGQIESSTVRFHGTWHFTPRELTPFVTGGLGWTYIDTNIPSGLPENVCWAYPWYGYYCATYVPTQSTTRFSYNVGAGLRLDAGRGVFRLLVNSQYADFGGSYGSAQVTQYRIDLGTKF